MVQFTCNVPDTLLSAFTLVNTSIYCAIIIESIKHFASWLILCDIQTLQIIHCSLIYTHGCTFSLENQIELQQPNDIQADTRAPTEPTLSSNMSPCPISCQALSLIFLKLRECYWLLRISSSNSPQATQHVPTQIYNLLSPINPNPSQISFMPALIRLSYLSQGKKAYLFAYFQGSLTPIPSQTRPRLSSPQ